MEECGVRVVYDKETDSYRYEFDKTWTKQMIKDFMKRVKGWGRCKN
jgi:hypothetical protein